MTAHEFQTLMGGAMRRMIFVIFLSASTSALAQQSALRACLEAEVSSATYEPIKGKLALSGGAQANTFVMMTDQTTPSEIEKPAIAAWADLMARCIRHDEPFLRAAPPDVRALMEGWGTGLIAIAAKLYVGELTYGQFNTQRSEMAQRFRTSLASIQQREQARAQTADDADYEARRQMAIQYLLGQQASQRSAPAVRPLQIPAPAMITNCYKFGNQTTCTTR